jgi:hypothetical protein
MRYEVRNHNGTLLGRFDDLKQAIAEMREYRYQTGNFACVEDMKEEEDES